MRQVEVRSFREDISERNRVMFMNDRREVNRINGERNITGGGPPPTQDVDLVDPEIFEDPDARMRAKMGLMDFPPLFVPPPDNPPIAPAAAANIIEGFSQYSNKEFSMILPVTTIDETPLNLTAVGGYEEGGGQAGGSGTSASAGGSGTSASAGGSGTSVSAGPSSAKRAKRTGTNPELSDLYVTR